MSIHFRTDQLTAAEISFLKWQYGFEEADDPFYRALWQTIMRAWISDTTPPLPGEKPTNHLARLGSPNAYPEEVALYLKFKSGDSDAFWLDLIRRAGLADRRQRNIPPAVERRRRASSKP